MTRYITLTIAAVAIFAIAINSNSANGKSATSSTPTGSVTVNPADQENEVIFDADITLMDRYDAYLPEANFTLSEMRNA